MTHQSAQVEVEAAYPLFSELNISPELKKGIKELGYVTPTDFQQGVYENFQNGRNVVGEGQSSYGKSLAFALPILAKLTIDQKGLQALVICESALMADLALKEYRALSRHLGIVVGNTPNLETEIIPHLLVLSVDDLAKCNMNRIAESLHTIFFDGLSAKNAHAALAITSKLFTPKVQVLLFGDMTVAQFKEGAKEVIDNAAFVSNNDQPKVSVPAKHFYLQAKEAEPKPRALLAALELIKPKMSLITCNEAQECDLLARYLSRYGYRCRVVNEENNRQGLSDALRECQNGSLDAVICQNSLLVDISLEHIPYMINYDMFDRPQAYEETTQFLKQAPGLQRMVINIITSRELGLLGPIKAQCQIDFSEMPLPSEDEIMDLCAQRIRDALLKEANEIELTQFEVLAKKIFNDPSAEPLLPFLLRNLFLRQNQPIRVEGGEARGPRERRNGRSPYERRRPERNERHERSDRGDRDDNAPSREPGDYPEQARSLSKPPEGITRLYVTLGRRDGLYDLASLAQYLSDKSGVDLGHFSGSGMIRDTSAHIEVDDDVAEDIIKALNDSPRPSSEATEHLKEPNPVVCERARQTVARHNRRPHERRRPHFQRR